MKKEFGRMAISQMKNTAKSCYLLTKEKEKLEKEIKEKQERLEQVNLEWDEYQAPIRRMTGGFTTNDLLDRVVTDTGKVDKEGRPIKTTNYVLKYPETIVPEVNESLYQQEISVGSDYDLDAQVSVENLESVTY